MSVYTDIARLPDFRNAVLTIGTFDGVHEGHRVILGEVIRHARREDGESVLITFEPHPRKLLFPGSPLQLLTPLDQKLELISAAGIRHIVVAPFTLDFAALSAREYISTFLAGRFHPRSIVIGYDHHFGHDRTGNIRLLEAMQDEFGYRVYEIPAHLIDQAAVSSTKIRNALKAGRAEEANHMLGRPYSIRGTVCRGAQLGRQIGFPTANIRPAHPDQLIPATGVYAVRIKSRDTWYRGMLNIGYNPTVSEEHVLRIEVNIFDFSGEIYDEEVELGLIARLRDEVKFDSLGALKEQLQRDRIHALSIPSF